ncbi:PAS domain-containing protein [Jannaschia sp. Os4]|uniref:CheR family methyltransferase n=1 Tax=Jannaschia sp. Os4 TaxID=2807617 RepID=UPI0019395878|nr:CheR family methyltransferase [Jannaschia sp. Os4]MBM2575572.1 PAS domain-containing protein [Jannaschia sp. Os4]
MPDDQTEELPTLTEPQLDFPIVGVGASAGGLEAVTELVRAVEQAPGMAFVLVQHLDPNHESMMAELLSRKTQLAVRQIEDGDSIETDNLYVIPPGSSLSIEDGRFVLAEFSEPRGLRRPIDGFLQSLAEAQGPMAASVIVSGTGADGSSGMRAVKDAGGVCVAQDPDEARYDGMPSAAIATGLVDFALPVRDIVPRLRSFFDRRLDPEALAEAEDVAEVIGSICDTLREVVGHDFGGYKPSTIKRRIERRMQILEVDTAREYLDHIRKSDDECEALFEDLLINVTAFFRDPEHFEELRERVIGPMVQNATAADEIRIWVPGCSSGQEAYSIAMLVDAELRDRTRRPQVQIFATDIDARMIATAREARYSASALRDIPPDLREAYTIGLDGQFQIAPRIRDMVRFSVHSLIKDPPFSKIDVISCRNMLIYLGDRVQRSVIPLMHFALKPGGTLFLGTSENITRRADLFEPISRRARIFRRLDAPARYPLDLPVGQDARRRRSFEVMPRDEDFPEQTRAEATNREIYEAYAPPFVRVDADGVIRDSSGDLSLFLLSAPTREGTLGALAREGLRDKLTPLVGQARDGGGRVALRGVEATSPFGTQTADVIAHPMKDGTVAVVFVARGRLEAEVDEYAVAPASRDARVAELEEDLRATRFRLKSTVEEVETANEELKSSNEEMMSMNEELQSANEELTTANEELKNKVDELAVANADLDTFMQSTDLAIVIVDRNSRIRHYTDAARALFPLQPTDRGRGIAEMNHGIDLDALPRHVAHVIAEDEPFERIVRTREGERIYVLRILPYRAADDAVDGATITFGDVTRLRSLEDDLKVETERSALALAAAEIGAFEFEIDTGVTSIDARVSELFDLGDERQPDFEEVFERIHPEDRSRTAAGFQQAVDDGAVYDEEFRVRAEDGTERWVRGLGKRIAGGDGPARIYGLNYDITEQREAMVMREVLLQEMSHRVKNLFAVLLSLIGTMPKDGLTAEEFAAPLRRRVAALGRVYDLARAEAEAGSVPLHDLVDTIVRAHTETADLRIEGPTVDVPVSKLTPMGLFLHELATNALKHGALARPDGTLDVTWRWDGEEVVLDWAEGPPGDAGADGGAEDGFGTKLIGFSTRQLQGTFDGGIRDGAFRARLRFAPGPVRGGPA